jgi:hypothetical protein
MNNPTTYDQLERFISIYQPSEVILISNLPTAKEMESSWEKIKMHCDVKLTIDLYKLGIVFFRQEQLEKENFIIRF